MPLRPRYSLLTLLLLTAVVAGGVKLWRGPHREVLSETPSAEQQIILDRLIYFQVFKEEYAPVVTELEYLNQGDQRAYLGVKSNSTRSRPIPVLASELKANHRMIPCTLPYQTYQSKEAARQKLALEIALSNDEHLVCWLYNPKFTREVPSNKMVSAKHRKPWNDDSTNWAYFLTSHKRLYVFHGLTQSYGINLKPIELHDIEDPEFREFVAAELARIPTP